MKSIILIKLTLVLLLVSVSLSKKISNSALTSASSNDKFRGEKTDYYKTIMKAINNINYPAEDNDSSKTKLYKLTTTELIEGVLSQPFHLFNGLGDNTLKFEIESSTCKENKVYSVTIDKSGVKFKRLNVEINFSKIKKLQKYVLKQDDKTDTKFNNLADILTSLFDLHLLQLFANNLPEKSIEREKLNDMLQRKETDYIKTENPFDLIDDNALQGNVINFLYATRYYNIVKKINVCNSVGGFAKVKGGLYKESDLISKIEYFENKDNKAIQQDKSNGLNIEEIKKGNTNKVAKNLESKLQFKTASKEVDEVKDLKESKKVDLKKDEPKEETIERVEPKETKDTKEESMDLPKLPFLNDIKSKLPKDIDNNINENNTSIPDEPKVNKAKRFSINALDRPISQGKKENDLPKDDDISNKVLENKKTSQSLDIKETNEVSEPELPIKDGSKKSLDKSAPLTVEENKTKPKTLRRTKNMANLHEKKGEQSNKLSNDKKVDFNDIPYVEEKEVNDKPNPKILKRSKKGGKINLKKSLSNKENNSNTETDTENNENINVRKNDYNDDFTVSMNPLYDASVAKDPVFEDKKVSKYDKFKKTVKGLFSFGKNKKDKKDKNKDNKN